MVIKRFSDRTKGIPGVKPSSEVRRRTRFTTKLDKRLLGELRRLAKKKNMSVNELIEEAIRRYFSLGS